MKDSDQLLLQYLNYDAKPTMAPIPPSVSSTAIDGDERGGGAVCRARPRRG